MPSPTNLRLAGIMAACCGLLLLAGCEDPSGVGLNVVDFGETDPNIRTVPAEVEFDSLAVPTGFQRAPLTEGFEGRFIVGRVEDPMVGTIEATGHIDFVPDVFPSTFFVADIIEVFLELDPDYRYGDTNSSAVIELYQIHEAWDAREFTADTEVVTTPDRQAITAFTATAADTLIRATLPEEWVAANDTLLRAFNVEQVFHGFQLRPAPESGLAVGFTTNSTLNVVWDTGVEAQPDTARYRARNIATAGHLTPLASPPHEALIPLQDNTGLGLAIDLRLDTLQNRAISAGVIRIEADTLLAASFRPPSFVRPRAETLVLYGLSDDQLVAIAEANFDEQKEAYMFSSVTLNVVLREMAFDRSRFDGLMVGFPASPRTLNVAPLVTTPDAPPRAVLVVTPLDP